MTTSTTTKDHTMGYFPFEKVATCSHWLHSREDNNTGVWQCTNGCGYTLCDECFKINALHATITVASTVDCSGTT